MMKQIALLAQVTFVGGRRDRLLVGVLLAALLGLASMPLFSSFSMRDVTGVAMTYSLSLVSVIGIIMVVFTGGSLIARDIQNRVIYGVATLPLSRTQYLLGKFCGFSLILACAVVLLGGLNMGGVWLVSLKYPPDQPLQWGTYWLSLLLEWEKLLILTAVLVLFSSIATSTFLPMLLTFAVYAVGVTTEKVKFFLETVQGEKMVSPALKALVGVIYYLFPNLTLFDITSQVVYGVSIEGGRLLMTLAYGGGYCMVMLAIACMLFSKRDFT
ncbi:hypothetical protein ANAEL_05349 [Anaerolineales bacterium]|nr:hypothetical protein ANAEL_05349 [Anaerolineales bacterium]